METYSQRPKALSDRANKLIMRSLTVSNSGSEKLVDGHESTAGKTVKARKSFSHFETSSPGNLVTGRKSISQIETNAAEVTAALLGVKVMAAEMPAFMQGHAFRCARRAYDGLEKFSSRQIAHDIKKVCADINRDLFGRRGDTYCKLAAETWGVMEAERH